RASSAGALTAPQDFLAASRGRLPYPLAIGNRWRYALHSTITLVDEEGSHPVSAFDVATIVEVTGIERVGDRDYFIVRQTFSMAEEPAGTATAHFRQDRSGLFVHAFVPPSNAVSLAAETAVEGRFAGELAARIERAQAVDPGRDRFARVSR